MSEICLQKLSNLKEKKRKFFLLECFNPNSTNISLLLSRGPSSSPMSWMSQPGPPPCSQGYSYNPQATFISFSFPVFKGVGGGLFVWVLGLFSYETAPHIRQLGLELPTQSRVTLNTSSSCFYLLGPGITACATRPSSTIGFYILKPCPMSHFYCPLITPCLL